MNSDKLTILWEQYLSGRMSRAEREELRSLLQEPSQKEFFEQLVDNSIKEPVNFSTDPAKEKNIQQVIDKIKIRRVTPPRLAFRWASAAAITLIIGAGAYIWFKPSGKTAVATNIIFENIQPGGDKAVLTLADGSTIILDSASNGALTQQGNSSIIKLSNGELVYQSNELPIPSNGGVASGAGTLHKNTSAPGAGVGFGTATNTMRTPAGGKYQITLPDGSKAWLNALSSITFPVTFSNNERSVKITGEVYFEIIKDKSRPFIVSKKNTQIQVLGTSFNANTYEDEDQLKITLLEGSIRVSDANINQSVILSPGQQTQISGSNLSKINNVDISKVMAWKNGLFNFEDANLDEVMRQVGRWYDIKIIYEKGIPDIQLWGKMSRNTNLSGLLKNLKDVGVRYRANEDKRELVILP